MAPLRLLSFHQRTSTGWRKAAKINCIILVSMSAVLVGCLISATSQSGQKALFFYSGGCDGGTVSQVSMALHLLINVVSTLVVDASHAKGIWLGIGVPSVRNIIRVSKFKTCCWIFLFLSSVPIHLLFNSTVFQTNHRESSFHMAVATEEFVHGGPYYLPGANLMDDYDPEDFEAWILTAATTSHQWSRLDITKCKEEYINCSGLKDYRNVVFIADKPGGWIRDGMCEEYILVPQITYCRSETDRYIQLFDIPDNQTKLWNQRVPPDKPNHLFTGLQCFMNAIHKSGTPIECMNTCQDYLGGDNDAVMNAPDWRYTYPDGRNKNSPQPEPRPGALDLSITSCLAEPIENICHVALSPTLLMAVTICVAIKTCTAILVTTVLLYQKQTPLVTLGDAIASFIEKPDPTTANLCTFDQDDARRIQLPMVKRWEPLLRRRTAVIPTSVWLTSYLLFTLGIVICAVFFRMALLRWNYNRHSPQLLLSFCYLAFNNLFTRLQMAREWALFSEEFRPLRVTDPQGEQYATYRLQLPYKYSLPLIVVSVYLHWLLSNALYLLISTGAEDYYKDLTTGLRNGGEAEDPSLPPGANIRLGFSEYALLAMLISSCVLITIPILLSLKQVTPNALNVGCNSFSISAACHVSRLSHAASSSDDPSPCPYYLPPLPFDLEGRPHSAPADEAPVETNSGDIEMQRLIIIDQSSPRQSLTSKRLISNQVWDGGSEHSPFRQLARSKIRWGVIQMPPEWYAEFGGANIEHLSFGVQEDDVRAPEKGHFYT
ncbi:hypothetical protein F5Y04DRAFT_273630 [Hypomontagnella monticulosa]|nr:hypothetical protein F5Y04DRAFT_273630 [Hypomontagnella monticulosa]